MCHSLRSCQVIILLAAVIGVLNLPAQLLTTNTTPSQTNIPPFNLNPYAEENIIHPPHPHWFEDREPADHLFRNWWGVRTNLLERGIKPSLIWVSDILGNPYGGDSQGFTTFNNIGLDCHFNMEKLAGVKGGAAYISASDRFGDCLTCEYIHNTFNVAQVCCGPTYRIVDIYYEQSTPEERFDIRFGRIAPGDEFLASPIFGTFVQNGVDGNPVGIFFNAPGMSAYPDATWGVRLRTRPMSPTGGLYAMAGVFNGDTDLRENDQHGANFSMDGPLFTIGEVGYRFQQGMFQRGLPGTISAGGWYDDHRYDRFIPAALNQPNFTRRGNTGFYIMVDQMVYREGKDPKSTQGLTPFVSVLISPDKEISTIPLFITGGFQYQGLIPTRGDDVAGFAVVYGAFSSDLREAQRISGLAQQNHETVLEWTYRIRLTSFFYVQPDVQYILRPGGTGNLPDALVLGAQLALSF